MNVIVAPSLGPLVDEKWIRNWDQTLTLRASGFVCCCFTQKITSNGMRFGSNLGRITYFLNLNSIKLARVCNVRPRVIK